MQLEQAIIKRRSVRKFSTLPLSREKIEKIIESAQWAPSASDKQLWKFIVIDDSKIKRKIVDEGGAKFIEDAPVGILVLYDNRTDNREYQDYIQSAAAAIQNMLLTATAMQIGSCWICHLPLKSRLRKLLKIPDYYDPIAYITLGYYEKDMKARPRRHRLSDIISWNDFNFEDVSPSISGLRLGVRRFIRSIYFRLPSYGKKLLAPIAEKFVKKFD